MSRTTPSRAAPIGNDAERRRAPDTIRFPGLAPSRPPSPSRSAVSLHSLSLLRRPRRNSRAASTASLNTKSEVGSTRSSRDSRLRRLLHPRRTAQDRPPPLPGPVTVEPRLTPPEPEPMALPPSLLMAPSESGAPDFTRLARRPAPHLSPRPGPRAAGVPSYRPSVVAPDNTGRKSNDSVGDDVFFDAHSLGGVSEDHHVSAGPHLAPPRHLAAPSGNSSSSLASALSASGTAGTGSGTVTPATEHDPPSRPRSCSNVRSELRTADSTEAQIKYREAKSSAASKLRPCDVLQSDDELKADIQLARKAVDLFLNSEMRAAEQLMQTGSQRLYVTLGAAILAVFKAVMTFDHEDLVTAVSYSKDAIHVASLLRKPTNMMSSLGRFVRGKGQPASAMHGMTLMQRHAELVLAESTLLKSVMGILLSGDLFAFVSEALSLRSVYGMYRSLAEYLAWLDDPAHAAAQKEVDEDFRSGVYLGNGSISLVFGLLPGKVLKVAELFGYTGSCTDGLAILLRAGRWTVPPSPQPGPAVPVVSGFTSDEEGIRRPVCDMAVLAYHLVISTFMPVQGTDIPLAQTVLRHYLERYPKGVFFLYFSGRLHSSLAQPGTAIGEFARARDVQRDILQLRALNIFEMALCSMSLCDWGSAAGYFQSLLAESSWSPAVYSYGVGATVYSAREAQASGDKLVLADVGPAHNPGVREPPALPVDLGAQAQSQAQADATARTQAMELMLGAPGRMQRIAGKSIPLEKFVAKKAAKLADQGYLLLPALELSYVFHCLTHAPARSLRAAHLPLVTRTMGHLAAFKGDPEGYRSGAHGWRADWCLVHFLHGVINRYIAHPDSRVPSNGHPAPAPDYRSASISRTYLGAKQDSLSDADAAAETSLVLVTQEGRDLTSDQYLVYFAHLELGRLLAARDDTAAAETHLNLLLSGTTLDRAPRKGKYALQNMCLLRAHGALSCLPPSAPEKASSTNAPATSTAR